MYFTDTPSLNHMEAIMKQPPGYRQRGGGSKRKSYQYTKADCSCRLCLHYQKKSGCTALICPVIDIRLKCGTASFNEAVKFVFKEVNHAAFQRRLNKYINQIKGGDFMLFRNNRHKLLFETERQRMQRPDNRKLAVLYLLTADDSLWRAAKRWLQDGKVNLVNVHLGNISSNSYALWKAVKEIQSGEKQISLRELSNTEDISDQAFQLIVQAVTVMRLGVKALQLKEESYD